MRVILDQVECKRRPSGDFERDPAQLSVPLARVRVTGEEKRSRYEHRKVDRASGSRVTDVHIAAMGVGRQRGHRLERGGRAESSEKRTPRKAQVVSAGQCPVGELVEVQPLGERVVQQRGRSRSGQASEERDKATDRPVAGRLDGVDPDGKRVARLGTFDVYRAGLWIYPVVQHPAGQIFGSADASSERVLRVDDDGFARRHRGDRRNIAREHVRVLPGLRDLS